ncbi:PfkB domain protein [Carbonactinospora thermoautotrophica]|uniref:PfkB domain protein n=1 Tax=Carbonactinospora thermoautotrophica TaxID=1469144 RepID=A0A132MRY4_9ACTN|nr:PfkB family carbohydrate kinase [Carbonactinospora thermoautotrophica]KWX00627.1 PfkB domain protein [Carbonactinospora thermoautotrophica]
MVTFPVPPLPGPYGDALEDPCEERADAGERLRAATGDRDGTLDVALAGPVFMDMIFTGLAGPPTPGTETWTRGLGSAPGGIANIAVAMSRLGLTVGLAAAFGDDMFGAYLWRTLAEQEQVDLSASRRVRNWPTPVTVSLAHSGDRSMVSYGEPLPFPVDDLVPRGWRARCCYVHLARELPAWARELRADGGLVFADVSWDETGKWSQDTLAGLAEVDVFLPNALEAMAYTRAGTPQAALDALLERVPVVVVKCGSQGAFAADRVTGERVFEAALRIDALDPTGAGDVFAAAYIFASLARWSLRERVRFANLCAGLSVRHHSGSLGAPCWHEIGEWFARHGLTEEYRFLEPYLPESAIADRARAYPTGGYGLSITEESA